MRERLLWVSVLRQMCFDYRVALDNQDHKDESRREKAREEVQALRREILEPHIEGICGAVGITHRKMVQKFKAIEAQKRRGERFDRADYGSFFSSIREYNA